MCPILTQENTINISSLFPNDSLPVVGASMDLGVLKDLVSRKSEFSLPLKLYIRREMRQLFEELQTLPFMTKIVSGSPGIGKSIIFFLTALFRATKDERSVFYFRWTKHQHERASAFLIQRAEGDQMLRIKFNRNIKKNKTPSFVFSELIDEIGRDDVITMLDGLPVEESSFATPLDFLCTSGGGAKITSEMAVGPITGWDVETEEEGGDGAGKESFLGGTINIVMSAWKIDDMKEAIMSCCVPEDGEFNEDLFDEIYYVTGGRIREAIRYYQAGKVDTRAADGVVDRVSKSAAKLAISRTDERSTSNHVDSLRSIFRCNESQDWDKVDIFVDSQYMVRKLHQKIDGQELLSSYHSAKDCGYVKAAAEYFEELLHWQMSEPNAFPSITCSVKGEGKGEEGVRMLRQTNCYWMPSIPNFMNIDAAIVRPDMQVWCFQYTTGTTHTYKTRRLRSYFIKIVSEIFEQEVADTTIIFVVPLGTDFTIPDTSNECNTLKMEVNCKNLYTLKNDLNEIVEKVIFK